MGAYLIDHPPVRDQFYRARNRPLTGCTVLHTAESVMDTVGPDTGAESVAEFIRTRTTPGSYHDLCDSDSYLTVVPYESGAYHDGTGSNNWALSISFACATSDWRAMSGERRAAFLRNGARAFVAQQAWRRSHGYPTTELRRITKAESDAGASGFIYHGQRDPGRRTDPGVAAPNLFPFDEWLDHCRAALSGTTPEEPFTVSQYTDLVNLIQSNHRDMADAVWRGVSAAQSAESMLKGNNPEGQNNFHWLAAQITAAVKTIPGAQVDEEQLRAAIASSVTFTEQAIATGVADEQDRRARDGDPTTGPVS